MILTVYGLYLDHSIIAHITIIYMFEFSSFLIQ